MSSPTQDFQHVRMRDIGWQFVALKAGSLWHCQLVGMAEGGELAAPFAANVPFCGSKVAQVDAWAAVAA